MFSVVVDSILCPMLFCEYLSSLDDNIRKIFCFQLLLTVFSALCYAIMVSLALVIYKEGTNIQFW